MEPQIFFYTRFFQQITTYLLFFFKSVGNRTKVKGSREKRRRSWIVLHRAARHQKVLDGKISDVCLIPFICLKNKSIKCFNTENIKRAEKNPDILCQTCGQAKGFPNASPKASVEAEFWQKNKKQREDEFYSISAFHTGEKKKKNSFFIPQLWAALQKD